MSLYLNVVIAFALLPVFFKRGAPFICDEGAIPCATGNKCVPALWKCDGEHDCIDGSDEESCVKKNASCTSTQFRCSSGRCLHKSWRCDGEMDCSDQSDEMNCGKRETCSPEMKRCKNGKCLSPTYVCDGDDDCGDMSDERNCSSTCGPYQFRCKTNGKCISKAWRCDRANDCDDGSDEAGCPTSSPKTCKQSQFRCSSGNCIPISYKCDGEKDCSDDSDERNCERGTCSGGGFSCGDGKCILNGWRCDGENDCIDGSDEINCTKPSVCPEDHYLCPNSSLTVGGSRRHFCIKKEFLCDGVAQCPDGHDEKNCSDANNQNVTCLQYDSKTCSAEENCKKTVNCSSCYATWEIVSGKKTIWQQGCWSNCSQGETCVGKRWMGNALFCCCNGNKCNDITKSTNETECPDFQCKDSTCVSFGALCDGVYDCQSREDETSCEKDCLSNLEIKSAKSPQDSRLLKSLRSNNILLNNTKSAWCTRKGMPGQWATLDLGRIRTLRGVTSMGYPSGTEPSYSNFTMQFSSDNITYLNYTEAGKNKVFIGSSNPLLAIKNLLSQLVKARFIRVFPQASSNRNYACMRIAVLGCDRKVHPQVKMNERSINPTIRKNAILNCTATGQRNNRLTISWGVITRNGRWEKLQSGHNHALEELKHDNSSKQAGLFVEKSIRLTYKYNFDYIRERFDCQSNKTVNSIVCTAEYQCHATYGSSPGPFVTAFVHYDFGPPVTKLELVAKNITESSAIVSWKLQPKPKYLLTVKAVLWIVYPDKVKKQQFVYLNSGRHVLASFQPFQKIVVQLSIPPNTLIGMKNGLRSNEAVFQTLVKEPGMPSTCFANNVETRSATFICRPPPIEERFGPIDGYILTYRKTGNQDRGEVKSISSRDEIIRVDGLEPSSTYAITAVVFNLLKGMKLKSKSKKLKITTLSERPRDKVTNVKANLESARTIKVMWSLPGASNGDMLFFDGFHVKVNEIYDAKRRKRSIKSMVRLIRVEKESTSKTITVSSSVLMCVIEVAMLSEAGTGPFSDPVVVHMKAAISTIKVSSKPASTKPVMNTTKAIPTKHLGSRSTVVKTNSNRKVNAGKSSDQAKSEKVFFIEFIIAVVLCAFLLIVILVLAYKTYTYRRKAFWVHSGENGHRGEEKNMETCLLDSEGEELQQGATALDSYSYPRTDYKNKIAMANF